MSFQDLESGLPRPRPPSLQQDPSRQVAAGIFQINTFLATFLRLLNSLGTPKDTLQLRNKLHTTRLQIAQLVKETSGKLKQVSETGQHVELSATKKIADAKLAKDFQFVLKEFQKALKHAADKESAYVPFTPPSSNNEDEPKTGLSGSTEWNPLLIESKRQDIVLMENEVVLNEAMIEEREQGIKEIQQQIGEVNEIFKDLAVLVHEQGVMIDDISSNIERSQATTAQGTSQLKRASKIQRSTSSMNCLLAVIFAVILLIVVVVVVA